LDNDPLAAKEKAEAANERLNNLVAITVAVLASFLGICKVKDDNIVQAMQQAQADKVDHWAFYQARNIREEVAKAALAQLQIDLQSAGDDRKDAITAEIARYEGLVKEQTEKKEEVKAQAENDQKTYDALNYRDDQFDLSDALSALAISLLAVTALTHKRWLFYLSLFPTAAGVIMGFAGLVGLHLHSDTLASWLS
jgi:hypothetical protein